MRERKRLEFHAMYLAHCEACRQAGIPEPTPERAELDVAERKRRKDLAK